MTAPPPPVNAIVLPVAKVTLLAMATAGANPLKIHVSVDDV
jgi:hypothetical protein